MSCGGIISDRALWQESWYKDLGNKERFKKYDDGFEFLNWNEKDLNITYFDFKKGNLCGGNLCGHKFSILMTPVEVPSKVWSTGNNRSRTFFTKEERQAFYDKMKEFAATIGVNVKDPKTLP